MKRLIALLLVLCAVLCACAPAEETQPSTEATTESTEVTTEETTEETTEVTEPPILYRHPLTGQPLEMPFTGRATAVVVNNIKAALPQFGISDADMIYEVETEGGITRLLAIYTDFSDVGTVGPIRSARTYFSSIALSYDAPLIHCGGSAAALKAWLDDSGTKIQSWEHINEQYYGKYFFRDSERISAGYSREHTLFTSGGQILQALADKEYVKVSDEEGTSYGLQFADVPELSGETANTVTVNFRYGKTTTMTYDPETGLYSASQYGKEHIDAATEECMTYRNLLVLYTTQRGKNDGTYVRSYYDTIGSGEGVFAVDGKLVPIKWSRDDYRGTFSYTLSDGTPLTLGTGTSYVAIVSTKAPATWE